MNRSLASRIERLRQLSSDTLRGCPECGNIFTSQLVPGGPVTCCGCGVEVTSEPGLTFTFRIGEPVHAEESQ